MNSVIRTSTVSVLLIALMLGCGPMQGYTGAQRPSPEVATIKIDDSKDIQAGLEFKITYFTVADFGTTKITSGVYPNRSLRPIQVLAGKNTIVVDWGATPTKINLDQPFWAKAMGMNTLYTRCFADVDVIAGQTYTVKILGPSLRIEDRYGVKNLSCRKA